jgi:regulatory protein SWI5
MNVVIKTNQASFSQSNTNAMAPTQDFELFAPSSTLSTPTFMTFAEAGPSGSQQGWISEGETASTHTRRSSRRISNSIMDKVARFEALGNGTESMSASRPTTPPHQNATSTYS